MKERAIPRSCETYCSLMSVCLGVEKTELALKVYHSLLDEGFYPNLATYHNLMDMYGRMGQPDDAIKLLDTILAEVCSLMFSSLIYLPMQSTITRFYCQQRLLCFEQAPVSNLSCLCIFCCFYFLQPGSVSSTPLLYTVPAPVCSFKVLSPVYAIYCAIPCFQSLYRHGYGRDPCLYIF